MPPLLFSIFCGLLPNFRTSTLYAAQNIAQYINMDDFCLFVPFVVAASAAGSMSCTIARIELSLCVPFSGSNSFGCLATDVLLLAPSSCSSFRIVEDSVCAIGSSSSGLISSTTLASHARVLSASWLDDRVLSLLWITCCSMDPMHMLF